MTVSGQESVSSLDNSMPPESAAHVLAVERPHSTLIQEIWALAICTATLASVASVGGVAWVAMRAAQLRLTPNPEAELLAALDASGKPVGPMLDAEYLEYGHKVFTGTCVACHGADGRGITGNGKDLVRSEFVASLDDDAFVAFLKVGRDPSDPMNTTKILMPPKGGNPALNEDDLYDVVEYVRGLQDPRRIPRPEAGALHGKAVDAPVSAALSDTR